MVETSAPEANMNNENFDARQNIGQGLAFVSESTVKTDKPEEIAKKLDKELDAYQAKRAPKKLAPPVIDLCEEPSSESIIISSTVISTADFEDKKTVAEAADSETCEPINWKLKYEQVVKERDNLQKIIDALGMYIFFSIRLHRVRIPLIFKI